MYTNEPRFFITPMLSVHNTEIFLYGQKDYINDPPPRHINSLNNLYNNNNRRKLSTTAKRKATRAVKYLLYNSNEKKVYNPKFNSSFTYKVGFITLTLPSEQIHTDTEIKKVLLNQFLVEARNRWQMTNYVWKAERQKNGNIHFHILTDTFIPHSEVRQVWNRIIEKLGYVTRFREKHKHRNPNTTDIHSLYKIKNIANYITKYMTKNENKQHEKIKATDINHIIKNKDKQQSVSNGAKKYLATISNVGRIWACSTNLSNLEGGRHELEGKYEEEIEKIKKAKRAKVINKEYVTCIYIDNGMINEKDTPLLYSLLQDFIAKRFKLKKQLFTYPPTSKEYL